MNRLDIGRGSSGLKSSLPRIGGLTGAILIFIFGGEVSTVLTQTSNCQANNLYPTSASEPAQGGTGSSTFSVSGVYGCAVQAFPSQSWITTQISQNGFIGTVNYSVAANPATTARTGSIIVGTSSTNGVTLSISQAGGPSGPGAGPAALQGDSLVVGAMSSTNFQLMQNLPLPTSANQKYCGPVQLAPGLLAEAYVPTPAERTANFSSFAGLLLDPTTGPNPPSLFGSSPFPGGIIPANRLPDPFAWRISSGSGSSSPGCAKFPLTSVPFSSLYYVTPKLGDNQILITSASPDPIALNSGTFTLTLRGRGFALASDIRVIFNGSTLATPSTNDGVELTVSVPAGLISSSTPVPVGSTASVQVASQSRGLKSNTLQIPLVTSAGPFLNLSPSSGNSGTELHIFATVGGTAQGSFAVASSTGASLAVQTSITKITPTPQSWVSVSPTNATVKASPQNFNVNINATGLAPGTYSALVVVTATLGQSGAISPSDQTVVDTKTVAVATTVTGSAISPFPGSLSFASVVGSGIVPASQVLGLIPVNLSGGTQHTYTASISGGNWFSIDHPTGNLPGFINVSVNPPGTAGTSYGQILVYADQSQSAVPVGVVMIVQNAANDQIFFSAYQPGGQLPQSQTRPLTTDVDESGFSINLTSEMNWLQVSPSNGETPQNLQFAVDPLAAPGLNFGSHVGFATVVDQNRPDNLFVIKATLSVTPPPPPPPVISSVGNAGSEEPFISPNVFVEIKGSNLAAPGPGIGWTGAPSFQSELLPTTLANVSVTVNGKPAYVSYVSSNQVNVLAPVDSATGNPVAVVVTNNGIASNPAIVPLRPVAPALFEFDFSTRRVAATHADNRPVAPIGTYPGSTPAAPNEEIQIWATGFGNTMPPIPDGQVVLSPGILANPVTVTVDGVPADVKFDGLVGAGLYQINVIIPPTARNGDLAIKAFTQGAQTLDGIIVAVQQ